MMLGNTGWDSYTLGESSQTAVLEALHFITTFVIMIHLLNMLIAIMGDTFARRSEVQNETSLKDHLSFVLDNWVIVRQMNRKSEKLRYIITAFNAS